jgi:predicted RNA-binding protein with RPS1 domain
MSKQKEEKEPCMWSGEVTRYSNALDLERGVFTFDDPRKIALSLKKSAEESKRRKAAPFQSAMSMLNFYINRAGKNLPANRRKILEQAKVELRKVFEEKARQRKSPRERGVIGNNLRVKEREI